MPTGVAPKTGDGIARVVMRFAQSDGEIAENVFGFKGVDGEDTSPDHLMDVCNVFKTWWEDGDGSGHSYRVVQHTGTQLLTITAKSMHVVDGAEVTLDVGESGTDDGEVLPDGITFSLTARTAQGGRSFRGRTFLLGLTKNFVSSDVNVADSTHVINTLLGFNALIPAAQGAFALAGGLVVLSFSHNLAYRTNIVSTLITSYGNSDLFMDYQRRRAPGHSRHH